MNAVSSVRIEMLAQLQMGGPEGVLKGEINRLTLQPGLGLWVNCIPRAPAGSKQASDPAAAVCDGNVTGTAS